MTTGAQSGVDRRTFIGIVGIVLAMAGAAFNQTSVATVLPLIISDLGGLEDYSIIFIASMVPAAVIAPLAGSIADRYGGRTVMIVGILIFCLGAIGSALSTSIGMLVSFRMVNGLGMGIMMTLSQGLGARLIPVSRRGPFFAVLGIVFGLASISGPIIGAWIAEATSWQVLFGVAVLPGLVAIWLVLVGVPGQESHTDSDPVDYAGAAALVVGAGSLMLAMLWGGIRYEWLSIEIAALFVLGSAGLGALIFIERRAPSPFVSWSELAAPRMAQATGAVVLAGALLFGAVLYMPLYLQTVRGQDPMESGVSLIAFAAGFALSAAISGALARGSALAWSALLGSLIASGGLFELSQTKVDDPEWILLTILAVIGAGLGTVIPQLMQIVQLEAGAQRTVRVSAMHQLARTFGGAIGVAVVGTIINNSLVDNVRSHLSPALQERTTGIGLPDLRSSDFAVAETGIDRIALYRALADGLHDSTVTAALVLFGAGIVMAGLVLKLAVNRNEADMNG